MFREMSAFVIDVPTRDLLVPYTKRSFQVMVGTLALQLQLFVNTKHRYYTFILSCLLYVYLGSLVVHVTPCGHVCQNEETSHNGARLFKAGLS